MVDAGAAAAASDVSRAMVSKSPAGDESRADHPGTADRRNLGEAETVVLAGGIAESTAGLTPIGRMLVQA